MPDEQKPSEQKPDEQSTATVDKPIIKVKNLNVTYFLGKPNEVKALKDINLKIYPGEFIIFFGPSGCGKSTLLYAISGLESNIMGEVLFEGKNINQFSYKELEKYHQEKTGLVFQAFYLINSLSVLKNVILPQVACGVKKVKREKRAKELLQHFGVLEQENKLPNELSGGQQQRVAISRALVNNPDILFADEPVGNLDSRSADDVMALIRNLNENQKKTVILVTHDPSHLNLADRVFYMKDGLIVKTRVINAINEAVVASREEERKPGLSKELELLARTFSSISGSPGNLLVPFKSKQIVTEVLSGMTEEEIAGIEKKVEDLLLRGIHEEDSLLNYLDVAVEKGGLGLDRRTSMKLANQIKSIVKEIKYLEAEEKRMEIEHKFDINKEAIQIRYYLLGAYGIKIEEPTVLEIIDEAIKDRLSKKIDKRAFQERIDFPIKRGGAGLDKRLAKKMAKHLELLILGKYR